LPASGSTEIASAATDAAGWLDEFAVIDKRTVITGSFNWSPSAAHQNDEVLLVIDSPLLAAHFSREMDRLWKGAELGITERLARKLQQGRQRCGSGIQRG
jgi:phosphatidylserine/phosphatidylglycerophosphate/cardiolipin synthase-like enzyme